MLSHGIRRQIGVALLIGLAAAMVVAPATASSQLDGDDCEPQREWMIVSMPEIAELDLTMHVDALEVLDRIEVLAIVDRGVEIANLESWQHRWVAHQTESDGAPRASHPMTAGIDLMVDLARLPGQAAMVTQHLLEAFAKVIPRVLRSLL